MRKVVANRLEWARGSKNGGENLLLGEGKNNGQCCIGIYLSAIGVSDVNLLHHGYIPGCVWPEEARWLGLSCGAEDAMDGLLDANDRFDEFAGNEAEITRIFAENGVDFTFTGEGHPRK